MNKKFICSRCLNEVPFYYQSYGHTIPDTICFECTLARLYGEDKPTKKHKTIERYVCQMLAAGYLRSDIVEDSKLSLYRIRLITKTLNNHLKKLTTKQRINCIRSIIYDF